LFTAFSRISLTLKLSLNWSPKQIFPVLFDSCHIDSHKLLQHFFLVSRSRRRDNRQVADARKTVYVLDANTVPLVARQSDVQINRAAEYKAHINLFHTLFFSLTPDDKFIEYQLKKAMYLVDESGALQYNNLKEKGFFNSILSSSAVLTLRTDSIYLDEPRRHFRFYGKQKIDRRSSTITRSLVTEG
jgi:conjugative transposon TraK protein